MTKWKMGLVLPVLLACATAPADAQAPSQAASQGATPTALPTGGEPYHLVIRDGRLLDGTGTPWVRADVAISGGRIVAVGDLSGARATRTIDAAGLYVAPGFIDTHTHAGEGLASEGLSAARPLLAQGVTTAFVNPDGGGPIDMTGQRAALLEHGLGVNVAQLIPHGSLRREVVGSDDRPATPAELARMRALVREGMEAGGFGLSTGLFYTPAAYASTEEVIELAREAGLHGGVYQSHIRDEADYNVGVVAAVDEVIRVAREAELPGIVTHIKVLGPRVWGYSAALVHRIERARAAGIEVFADQYPYEASATSLTAALVPNWAMDGGREALLRRLEDPTVRERLTIDMADNLDRRGGADRIQFRRHRADPSIEGRTLAAVAEERGLGPIEAAMALLREGSPSIVSFNMHPADLHRLMRQPWTMTASDGALVPMNEGVPHPRGYGTFARKIRKYVMEDGIIDLATAIRSMTHMPATVYHMEGRGIIRAGAVADVVVFRLDRINDPSEFTDPHHLAEGMVHVLVNGELVIDDGRFTDARPGRVLHRGRP